MKSKRILIITALVLMALLASGSAWAGEMAYVNQGPDKTVYARPDVTSEVQGTLYNGSHLVVLGWQGSWANVAVNNVVATQTIGWVDGAGLSLVGEAVPGVAVVNNPNPRDRLNLRTQPRESAPSLGKYYNGTVANPLDSVKNGWMKLRIGSLEGYMEAKYLLMGAQPGDVQSAMPLVTIRNTEGTGLNLRLGQSTSSKIIRFYPNGTKLTVMGLGTTWCHVNTEDGYQGFVLARHLYPRLSYHLSGSVTQAPHVTPRPTAIPSGSGFDGWSGPVGYHPVAAWPLGAGSASIANPNPADRLNLRTQPRSGAPSLGKYYNGVQVDVYEAIPGGWSRVNVGGLDGYMQSQYLDFSGRTPSAIPVMRVYNPGSAGNLHLRAGKTTASRSLGLYPNGSEVLLIGFDGTWAHVIVEGRIGFMQHRFLR